MKTVTVAIPLFKVGLHPIVLIPITSILMNFLTSFIQKINSVLDLLLMKPTMKLIP